MLYNNITINTVTINQSTHIAIILILLLAFNYFTTHDVKLTKLENVKKYTKNV